jgi:hypothetical protein
VASGPGHRRTFAHGIVPKPIEDGGRLTAIETALAATAAAEMA